MGATMAGSPGAAIGASQTTVALAGDRLPPPSATTRPDTLMSSGHKAGVAHSASAILSDTANFLAIRIFRLGRFQRESQALKGHGSSRAVSCCHYVGFSHLGTSRLNRSA